MKLLTCLLTENDCYRTKRTITPKGVMVHSTGANNPNLRRYVQPVSATPGRELLLAQLGQNINGNHWNRAGIDACVHGFVGRLADGSVAAVQTLPWNHRGWHAGDGASGKSANNTHISFEICEDDLTDPVYFARAYQAAAELTAMLCSQYGLDPLADGVVICHQDGYRRGVASNHGDVYNWFPKFGKTMDDFRADVVGAMARENGEQEDDDMTYFKTLADVPEWYRDAVQKAVDKGALHGTGNSELNVSEDLCRTLTVLDRLGKLD